MKIIVHDLGESYNPLFALKADQVICADGRYATCRGCFKCWSKHPTECTFKDSLHRIAQTLGQADTLILVSRNCYGSYSPPVKALLDRSISQTTPLATFRAKRMHSIPRYGKKALFKGILWGDMTPQEQETFRKLVELNAATFAFKAHEAVCVPENTDWEAMAL